MEKENAKWLSCILLGAESIGMMSAFIIGVLSIAAWGDTLLSARGQWAVENGYYLLAVLAFIYGFILRPIRRRVLSVLGKKYNFSYKIYYWEGIFVTAFMLCGWLSWFGLSFAVLTTYSIWKLVELISDTLFYQEKEGLYRN